MKYTRFQDIPPFTRDSSYSVNVGWGFIEETLSMFGEAGGIDLDPDFQRAHVWDEHKQRRYVEFILREGKSSRNIFFNCATWSRGGRSAQPVYLVDGKQRLEAVRRFMRDELRAFGSLRSEYTDSLRMCGPDFVFHVNDLKTRAEMLQWYLDLNDGGVAHTDDEIEKVRKLLAKEQKQSV